MLNARRKLLLGLGSALALHRLAIAQRAGRVHRICWLSAAGARKEAYNVAFVDQLRKLGFVEGQNLQIEFRSAEGRVDRLPELAAELARQDCDAFLAPGSEANLVAVKQATRDTPIIMVAGDYDPLARGHVASLARPGGRITGVHQLQVALVAKRVELIRELLPKARRIGVISDIATTDQLKGALAAAKQLGVELQVHEFKSAPYDFEAAFEDLVRRKAEAVLPLGSGFFVLARKRITDLALKHRLPGMYSNYLWAESGGLLSYGPNFAEMFRRAAEQMSKVLKGVKPADLPVEQPAIVELVINMKTAKALGITIAQGVWFRADRVIE